MAVVPTAVIGGGGTCTFGFNTIPTPISCGTVYNVDNSACPEPECLCTGSCANTYDCSGGKNIGCPPPPAGCKTKCGCVSGKTGWCWDPFSVDWDIDICENATAAIDGDCVGPYVYSTTGLCRAYAYIDKSGAIVCEYESAAYTTGKKTATPENPSNAQYCAPTTMQGSCPFTFSISNISCSGGAGDLQYSIYRNTAACGATMVDRSANCRLSGSGGTKNAVSVSATVAPGECIAAIFDGNCGASCQWQFSVQPNFTPTITTSLAGSGSKLSSFNCTGTSCTLTCSGCSKTGECCVDLNVTGGSCYTQFTVNGTPYSSSTTNISPVMCFTGNGTYSLSVQAQFQDGSCNTTSTTTNYSVSVNCVLSLEELSAAVTAASPAEGITVEVLVLGNIKEYSHFVVEYGKYPLDYTPSVILLDKVDTFLPVVFKLGQKGWTTRLTIKNSQQNLHQYQHWIRIRAVKLSGEEVASSLMVWRPMDVQGGFGLVEAGRLNGSGYQVVVGGVKGFAGSLQVMTPAGTILHTATWEKSNENQAVLRIPSEVLAKPALYLLVIKREDGILSVHKLIVR